MLFAAPDVASGEVVHERMPRHRHQEFLRFVKKERIPSHRFPFGIDHQGDRVAVALPLALLARSLPCLQTA